MTTLQDLNPYAGGLNATSDYPTPYPTEEDEALWAWLEERVDE